MHAQIGKKVFTSLCFTKPRRGRADSVLPCCTRRTFDTSLDKDWGIRSGSEAGSKEFGQWIVRSWSLGNPSIKIIQGVETKKSKMSDIGRTLLLGPIFGTTYGSRLELQHLERNDEKFEFLGGTVKLRRRGNLNFTCCGAVRQPRYRLEKVFPGNG